MKRFALKFVIKIKHTFTELGIEIPYSKQDVYLYTMNSSSTELESGTENLNPDPEQSRLEKTEPPSDDKNTS